MMFRKSFLCLLIWIFSACSGDTNRQDQLLLSVQEESSARVLVIGFDGATWDMFGPAMDKGLMPRLKSLIAQGVRAPLKTITPTITPIIWTTIATGKLPEEHGVISIVDRDPVTGEMKPLTSNTIKVKTIWEILSERDKDVTVIRWPVTWPASKINGEMITDFAFQKARSNRVWPETLNALVNAKQDFSRLADIQTLTDVDRSLYQSLDPLWQWKLMVLLREYVLDVQFKDIARSLFEQKQRSFTAVYFYSLDALGHNYYRFLQSDPENETPDFQDLVMNWCWLYDQFLTEILDTVDPDTHVILCSDHGMELALKPQDFLILSEDSPPPKDQEPVEISLPTAPEFDVDPFSIKLLYTAPSGQHVNKPDGIFLIAGPHVKRNWQAPPVSVTEIAPTILYLMGQPVPKDFTDSPRLDLFQENYVNNHVVKTIDTYENDDKTHKDTMLKDYSEEDDLLLNRLEALGYI
ncbi:alkaline phosphatase family protein [bacterium]|nr:alkaline phosphatase family protein [bacterium]